MEPTIFDKTKKAMLVYPDLASLIGPDSAAFVQQVHYWLSIYVNLDDQYHFWNGRWWIWNSYAEWSKQIRWMTPKVVRRIVSELREMGILIVESKTTNRALWYTIDHDRLKELLPVEDAEHVNTFDYAPQGTPDRKNADRSAPQDIGGAPQGKPKKHSIRSEGKPSITENTSEKTHIPGLSIFQERIKDQKPLDSFWSRH